MRLPKLHRLFHTQRVMAATALGAFLAVVVFLSLGSHMAADGETCLLDQLQKANCISMSATEMVTFHANAVTRFVSGALIPNLALLLVFFVVVLAVLTAAVVPRHPPGIYRVPDHGPPPIVRQITHWLSLLIASPPSLIFGRA